MTQDEVLAALDGVRAAMREQFDDDYGTHEGRLAALESVLSSAAMHAAALYDEEMREVDLAQRIMGRAKVYGNDEVISPFNRPLEHTRVIAVRAG